MPAADAGRAVAGALRAGHLHQRQRRRAAPARRVAGRRRRAPGPPATCSGLTAPDGSFTQLGIGAQPGVMQGVEVLVKRPAGLGASADGVRIVLAEDQHDHHRGRLRRPPGRAAQGQRGGDRRRPGGGRALGGGLDALDHDHRRRRTRSRRSRPASPTTAPGRRHRAARVDLPDRGAASTSAISALQATLRRHDRRRLEQPRDQLLHQGAGRRRHRHRGRRASTTLERPDRRPPRPRSATRPASGSPATARSPAGSRTIEARSDPGSVVANGSFATGELHRLGRRSPDATRVHRRRQGRHRLGAAELPDAATC